MKALEDRRQELKRRGQLPEPVRRQEATQATLDKFKGKAFSWQGATCAHLLRYHLRMMGHKPPAIPAFRSPISARTAMKKLGGDNIADVLRAIGMPEIPPAMMMLGDVAVLPGDDGIFDAITINAGVKLMGWHPDAEGLVVMDVEPAAVIAAFRV